MKKSFVILLSLSFFLACQEGVNTKEDFSLRNTEAPIESLNSKELIEKKAELRRFIYKSEVNIDNTSTPGEYLNHGGLLNKIFSFLIDHEKDSFSKKNVGEFEKLICTSLSWNFSQKGLPCIYELIEQKSKQFTMNMDVKNLDELNKYLGQLEIIYYLARNLFKKELNDMFWGENSEKTGAFDILLKEDSEADRNLEKAKIKEFIEFITDRHSSFKFNQIEEFLNNLSASLKKIEEESRSDELEQVLIKLEKLKEFLQTFK